MDCNNWSYDKQGPLQIDYLYFYECQLRKYSLFADWILFLWVIYLINIVITTASNYFSPTLASICKRLRIRYDIAGVTFLAFGNGAPDVFSSITSFSGGADVDIGIGSLLGGSMFVSTVVVGSVAMICPTEVTPKFFVRDIVFHIIAVSTVTIVGILGYVAIWTGLIQFVIYLIYVVIVLTSGPKQSEPKHSEHSNGVVVSGIQTAFWHPSASKKKAKNYRRLSQRERDFDSFDSIHNVNDDEDDEELNKSGSNGYKFLIVNDLNNSNRSGEDGEITIDLFGGLNSSVFSGHIVDDYFNDKSNDESGVNDSSSATIIEFTRDPEYHTKKQDLSKVAPFEIDDQSTLTRNLLELSDNVSSADIERPSISHMSDASIGSDISLTSARTPKQYKNMLSSFYWKQQAMGNKIRRNLFLNHDEWVSLSIYRKLWVILEFPVALSRDLTIPTLDPSTWNKYYAIIHPIACSLFLIYLFGYFNVNIGNSRLPTSAFGVIITFPMSIAIYLLTHFNKPPQDVILANLWNITAFIMSIAWIYTLSKELVICLSSIGDALRISSGFLGLTVLAWGNSIGDLISNSAIARQGLGEMALAGCYGGPVFNILIGLGLAFAYASAKEYPSTFAIRLNISSIISLVFLYVSLTSTLAIVIFKGFRLERSTGMALIGLYILYTVVQIAILPVES